MAEVNGGLIYQYVRVIESMTAKAFDVQIIRVERNGNGVRNRINNVEIAIRSHAFAEKLGRAIAVELAIEFAD